MKRGTSTPFTCPECHGVLEKLQEGKLERFRCHAGRAFTPSALLVGITAVVGETMWGLEEATMLLWQMGDEFQSLGQMETTQLFFKKAREAAKNAQIVHDSLPQHDIRSKLNMEKREADPSLRPNGCVDLINRLPFHIHGGAQSRRFKKEKDQARNPQKILQQLPPGYN